MNVRDLNIVLRQRMGWEGVDLGFGLVRRSFGDLQKISFLTLGGFAVLMFAVFWKWPYVAAILVWWLKPVTDRFLLYYLSRHIFGQKVTVRETLRKWKVLLTKGMFPWLMLRRFSPSRSMTMPISDLEELVGKGYQARVGMVSRVGGDTAVMLTIGMLFLQLIFLVAIFITMVSFLPQASWEEITNSGDWFMEEGKRQQLTRFILWGAFVVVGMFLEPFYVGGGFALYLNSRTMQEAWDVELTFRELAARVERGKLKLGGRGVAGCVAAMLGLGCLFAMPAKAADAQGVIEEVLGHEDFIIHKVKSGGWESKWDWGIGKGDGSGIALTGIDFFFRVVGIAALVGLAVLLGMLLYHTFKGRRFRGEKLEAVEKRSIPTVVMGMEVTPESLPHDLLREARRRWQGGEAREALSLLYRGALSHLINERAVVIEASDTESECYGRVSKAVPAVAGYFGELSRDWMQVAYSHQPLAGENFERLLERWPFAR